jgi:predicted RNA binding protein YcfA (HicA-like mRNA interferase family)
MKYREVERRLNALGCVEIRRRKGGSHRKWSNPASGAGAVLPDWGAKDLRMGTVRAAIRQLGLEWEEFLARE